MDKGKITNTGFKVGAIVGTLVGKLVEGTVETSGKLLKKSAELTVTGFEKGRKVVSHGLESVGQGISDAGIERHRQKVAKHRVEKAKATAAKYGETIVCTTNEEKGAANAAQPIFNPPTQTQG